MKYPSELEIMKMASFPDCVDGSSFVYFLVSKGKIVYVGQTKNLKARIENHSLIGKFDTFSYIKTDSECVDVVESFYIHMLNPKLNGNSSLKSSNEKHAPISICDLIEVACLGFLHNKVIKKGE